MSEVEDFNWNEEVKATFIELISRVPGPMKQMAQEQVLKRLGWIVEEEKIEIVDEKVMVDAFFKATPFGFHGPLKCDMEAIGIDYTKYGYDK